MMFHESENGRIFFQRDMPKIADSLEYVTQNLHPDMLKIAEQLEILNHHLSKEVTQSMIAIEEVDDYLRNGWRYIGSVHNSRETFVIVETDERR